MSAPPPQCKHTPSTSHITGSGLDPRRADATEVPAGPEHSLRPCCGKGSGEDCLPRNAFASCSGSHSASPLPSPHFPSPTLPAPPLLSSPHLSCPLLSSLLSSPPVYLSLSTVKPQRGSQLAENFTRKEFQGSAAVLFC